METNGQWKLSIKEIVGLVTFAVSLGITVQVMVSRIEAKEYTINLLENRIEALENTKPEILAYKLSSVESEMREIKTTLREINDKLRPRD